MRKKKILSCFSDNMKSRLEKARKISIEAILEENARRDIKIITANDKECQ